jgi:hypothetical protein
MRSWTGAPPAGLPTASTVVIRVMVTASRLLRVGYPG